MDLGHKPTMGKTPTQSGGSVGWTGAQRCHHHRHSPFQLTLLVVCIDPFSAFKVLARNPISGTSWPDSDCRCTREPTIVGAPTLIAQQNIRGENPLRARRDFVAEALPSGGGAGGERLCERLCLPSDVGAGGESARLPLTTEPLKNGLVCPQAAESRKNVLASSLHEEPMKNVLLAY